MIKKKVDLFAQFAESVAATSRPWVLGVDPGLATCAVAIVDPRPHGDKVVGLRFFRTKEAKGEGYAASLLRRADELESYLRSVLACRPAMVFVEEFSFLRAAKPNAMLSRAWGVLQALVKRYETPLVEVPGNYVKKLVAGTKTADKRDVIRHVGRMYPEARLMLGGFSTEDREHPADALAIYHAGMERALESEDPRYDVVRGLRSA